MNVILPNDGRIRQSSLTPPAGIFLTLSPADFDAVLDRLDRIERAIATTAPAQPSEPLLFNREQAAAMLDASVSSVDAWRRDGLLRATYLDRKPRFTISDLKSFIASRQKQNIHDSATTPADDSMEVANNDAT